MLTRKKLGYAPGTMDATYLAQDIDTLEAELHSGLSAADELLSAADEFETEARRLGARELLTRVLIQRANILMANQRYQEAIPALIAADQALGDLRQYDLKVSILAGLAEAQANLQEWQVVLETCEEGIALVERYRYTVSGQYLQSAYLRSRIGLYARGVRAAYERKEYALMLHWAELSKCRSVLRHRQKSLAPSGEERRIQEEFRRVSKQIDAARTVGNKQGLDVLLAKRRTLWDLLLIQRARARADDSLPEFDLAAVQAVLHADEAVLYYYWLDLHTLLVVALDRERCVPVLHRITQAERSALEQFARAVLESLSPQMPGYLDYVEEVRNFAPLLLHKASVDWLHSKRRLLVSPHRLLHALPFHALPWEDGTCYLIQRFAITHIPNLSSLLVPYPAPLQTGLLALGVSNYRTPGYPLVPLKEAVKEVSDLHDLYARNGMRVSALCDAQVNETWLRRSEQTGELSAFSILHIATHGLNVNSDTPMESFLFLHDSILDGLEIADWRLDAELVVLSACFSGQRSIAGRGMAELPGDDLFGLQAAFFAAGARQVLGSLWPVDSAVACSLLTAFHRYLVAGLSPDRSLQSAVLDYLKRAGPRLRKSYFWAPFFISAIGRLGPRPA